MKRGNGDGNVMKLQGNRRKPYMARITKWKEVDGKYVQKRVSIGTFATRLEAENALYLYSKSDYIKPPERSCITLREAYDYLDDVLRFNRSDNYYNAFKSCISKFEDYLDVRMDRFTTPDLQRIFDDYIRKGYKKSTLQFYKSLLSKLFDYGVRQEYINRNPVTNVDLSLADNSKKYDASIFTPKEIEILWQDKTYWSKVILLMIYTGMRPFEALDLLKENVDLNERTIKITKSKTKSGIRTIPICSKIYPVVQDLYFGSKEYLLEIDYENYRMTCYTKHFKEMMNKYNLTHKPYDTRHTFATLLDMVKADDVSIKLIMGHSVDDLTKSVYTHRDISRLKEATDLLNSIS